MGQRIYIVEDHPVMRQGYEAIIEQNAQLEICGGTGSAEQARERILALHPDLVIVDLSIEEGSGLDLIKDLLARQPNLPILVVSMHDESVYANRVLQAGARGYLMKNKAYSHVDEAIRRVLDGGIYLSEALRNDLLMRHVGQPTTTAGTPFDTLSDRELEVFEYLGQGLTPQEIAERLLLSAKTVNSYRSRLKEKLDIATNAELQRRAVIWMEQAALSSDTASDD